MERKYKLTILPLFEEELNHIVDYITYVLHNREAAHQLINFYIFYVVIEDVMEVHHIYYNRRDLQNILND